MGLGIQPAAYSIPIESINTPDKPKPIRKKRSIEQTVVKRTTKKKSSKKRGRPKNK